MELDAGPDAEPDAEPDASTEPSDKCPLCGEYIPPYSAVCPSCGYERRIEDDSALAQLYAKLDALDSKASLVARAYAGPQAYRAVARLYEQQASLIRGFVPPANKTEIVDYLSFAESMVENAAQISGWRGTVARSKTLPAWQLKMEQLVKRLDLSYGDKGAKLCEHAAEIASRAEEGVDQARREKPIAMLTLLLPVGGSLLKALLHVLVAVIGAAMCLYGAVLEIQTAGTSSDSVGWELFGSFILFIGVVMQASDEAGLLEVLICALLSWLVWASAGVMDAAGGNGAWNLLAGGLALFVCLILLMTKAFAKPRSLGE